MRTRFPAEGRPIMAMIPSLIAFVIASTAVVVDARWSHEPEWDQSMSATQDAIRQCPIVRAPAEDIALRRTPTEVDAAAIVSMANRASRFMKDCLAPREEAVPAGAYSGFGYWMTRDLMEASSACPATLPLANAAVSDGILDKREVTIVRKSISNTCPDPKEEDTRP